jgi:large subunit ribosomal protein L35
MGDASYTAHFNRARPADMACRVARSDRPKEETEMPKMKTKSSCKKRFKVTASGRVVAAQAGKQHGMIKRSNKFLRNARGTTTLCKADEGIIKPMMPYAK